MMATNLAHILQPRDWRTAAVKAAILAVVAFASWWSLSVWRSPLRQYPGPFFARWTNLYRLLLLQTGRYPLLIRLLHDKYGPVVRIGPNLLDLDFPELIKVLYSTGGKWKKTEFYQNNSAVIDGKITYHLFSQTDQTEHARLKRPVVKHYSQGNVLAIEPLMDTVIADFCDKLESGFMTGPAPKPCDLGAWLEFFSWDMNGVATFSHTFGYMDKGFDHDGTIHLSIRAMHYFGTVGQMPWLDYLLDKNPIMRIGPPNLQNVTNISARHLLARVRGEDANFDPDRPDFLDRFLQSKRDNPDLVDDKVIMGYLLVNLIAAADTTTITMRSVFYYALRHPEVYRKMEEEIVGADLGEVASYHAARALPYLEAVTREAMRLHPAVGMQLERYVPEGGLNLPDGRFVAAGAAVGINPWINGRNRHVWGDDADTFRPERWLRGESPGPADETEPAYRERMRLFNASDLTFGNGSRVCIGRHLAMLQLFKTVATLVARYHICLVDPAREWSLHLAWFARQDGLVCYFRERQ